MLHIRHSFDLFISFFFQAEDGIRDVAVTGVQTCALPIYFIYESMTQPQAYVYKDYEYVGPPKFFPAKMPSINKKPIGLSKNEMLAVIAFLQNMSGEEVTIELSEIEAPGPASTARKEEL